MLVLSGVIVVNLWLLLVLPGVAEAAGFPYLALSSVLGGSGGGDATPWLVLAC